jgi:hypothetical protein
VKRATARLAVVLLGLLAALTVAGPASAHVGGGAAGSDFDGRIVSVTPEVPGVSVRILQFGDEFELVNETSTEVVVPGYSDEPYLRIGPDGVWRNANSPATYLNLDRFGQAQPPANADAEAEPDWQQVSTQPQYVWHDHRTHWMSENQLPPTVQADPTQRHTVAEWTVPLVHGSTEMTVEGVLTWTPPPSPAVTWPVYVGLVLLAVAAGLLARTARLLGVLMAVGAAAALWHAAMTPAPPASIGSHTGAILSALLPAGTAVIVAVIGVRAAWRGRGAMAGLMAVVLGWLFMVQGLPDVDVLWSAHVATDGPEFLARAAVTVLVTFGIGLVLGGIAAVRRFREPDAPRRGAVGSSAPVPVG